MSTQEMSLAKFKVFRIAGYALAIVTFFTMIPSLQDSPSALWFIAPFVCAWTGLPLIILGSLKVFRRAERLSLIMFGIGVSASAWGIYGSYIAPGSSTDAIAAILIPLYLLFLYGVYGVALFMISGR